MIFTVDAAQVKAAMEAKNAVILDVRPHAYFIGEKSDEARAGHIPGAVNRPFSEDLVETPEGVAFKPKEELEKAYARAHPKQTNRSNCALPHRPSSKPDRFRFETSSRIRRREMV